MFIGILLFLSGTLLGARYYFVQIADHDQFYSDPSPVPLFIYTFISGVGLMAAAASFLVYIMRLRK
ncbi:hypothetical protein JOC55_002871 [Paenibacillus sacheonensis]|nr:hypothetical protein [Paenibacillus sacheonensis]